MSIDSFQALEQAAKLARDSIARNQATLIAFAKMHDWGYDAQANDDGSVTVGCECHLASGDWVREFKTVRTMRELRNLAGY